MAITPELVVAYSLCPRKAFLMLRGDQAEHLHEYVNVIDRIAAQSRDRFVGSIDVAQVRHLANPHVLQGDFRKLKDQSADHMCLFSLRLRAEE